MLEPVVSDTEPWLNSVAAEGHQAWLEFQAASALDYAKHDEVQISLRECMKLAGFDYEPIPRPAALVPLPELADQFSTAASKDPLTVEYREVFGLGVSTLWAYLVFIEPMGTDPNARRRGEMGPDERRKYDIAYYGLDLVKAIEASSDGVVEMNPGGCLGSAREGSVAETMELEVVEQANEVEERLVGSPSYVLAEQEWARFVGALGYDVQRPSEAWDWLALKLDELGQEALETDIVVTDDPASAAELSPDAVVLSESEAELLGARSPYPADGLADLQAWEIEFSLEIRDCDVAFHEDTLELREALERELS